MANDLQPPENGRLPSAATHFAGPLVATTNNNNSNNSTPLSTTVCKYSEELPCEKYRQFMDSSRQERTFMIEKLVGKYSYLQEKKRKKDAYEIGNSDLDPNQAICTCPCSITNVYAYSSFLFSAACYSSIPFRLD